MHDCQAKILLTADGAWRGEKPLHLKSICDEAMDKASAMGHNIEKCIVVSHLNRVTPGSQELVNKLPSWTDDRDLWWHEEMEDAEKTCYPEWMGAEDPLFMLYTSGSTGKTIKRIFIPHPFLYLHFSINSKENRRVFYIQLVDTYCTLAQHLNWFSITSLVMCIGVQLILDGLLVIFSFPFSKISLITYN